VKLKVKQLNDIFYAKIGLFKNIFSQIPFPKFYKSHCILILYSFLAGNLFLNIVLSKDKQPAKIGCAEIGMNNEKCVF